jgi:hypothetical protein
VRDQVFSTSALEPTQPSEHGGASESAASSLVTAGSQESGGKAPLRSYGLLWGG